MNLRVQLTKRTLFEQVSVFQSGQQRARDNAVGFFYTDRAKITYASRRTFTGDRPVLKALIVSAE